MNDPQHRCDARDFVFDLTNFIKEQIERAVADPSDQLAATDAAAGVVPVIAARLVPDHEPLWANLVLSINPYFDSSDGDCLASLGKQPRETFLTAAADLLERITFAQTEWLTSREDHRSCR